MECKKLFTKIVEKLQLSSDRAITDFDETYTGRSGDFDISASYREQMAGQDKVCQIKLVWVKDQKAVSFEAEKYDYEEILPLRFATFELELDPVGQYEVDRKSVSGGMKFKGGVRSLIRRMRKTASRITSAENGMLKEGSYNDGTHALKNLRETKKFAKMLMSKINEGDNLPEWVVEKIVIAANDLNDIFQYMDNKSDRI